MTRYTTQPLIKRAASALWDAMETHVWLPLAIAIVCLVIINCS